MSKQTDKEREGARAKLLAYVKPGDTTYTILRHVSRSGMIRVIDLNVIRDGEPWWIGGLASMALGCRYDDKRQGVRVGGCGMDIGFHLVYELSHALFSTGFGCIGATCPSNDHINGDRDYTPHPGCGTPDKRGHRDHWHKDGGYALRHRWL